jgi:hypothetical protein
VSTPRWNSRPPRLLGLQGHPLTDQSSNQILDHSIQNHPKPVSFLSSGVSSRSGLPPLNPSIDHTYVWIYINIYTVDTCGVNRLASQICHIRLFRKKLQHNLLRMTSTEVSSLATHNTVGPFASRSAIQSDTLSIGLKHLKPVCLLSSGAPPESGLTPLIPTIVHAKKPHLALIVGKSRSDTENTHKGQSQSNTED